MEEVYLAARETTFKRTFLKRGDYSSARVQQNSLPSVLTPRRVVPRPVSSRFARLLETLGSSGMSSTTEAKRSALIAVKKS